MLVVEDYVYDFLRVDIKATIVGKTAGLVAINGAGAASEVVSSDDVGKFLSIA